MTTEAEYKINTDVEITFTDAWPVVDGHMHIQSNDIAPIPVMKGILHKNINIKKLLKIGLIKKINLIELDFLNVNNPKNAEMRKWAVELARLGDIALGIYSILPWNIFKGERERITDLTNNALTKLFVKDYGAVTRHSSFNIATIYMNDKEIKTNMTVASKTYIKDGIVTNQQKLNESSEKERIKLINNRDETGGIFSAISLYYNNLKDNSSNRETEGHSAAAGFDFSILHGMELMYAHYWGAYGIPVYISYVENGGREKIYFITNEIVLPNRQADTGRVTLHNGYDISKAALAKYVEIHDVNGRKINAGLAEDKSGIGNEGYKEPENGTKYCHLLCELEDSEKNQYEHFEKHCNYTKMAALQYPFRLLPFYHFDARRFFSQPEEIRNCHEFLICKGTSLQETDIDRIISALNGEGVFQYKTDIEDLKKELLVNGGLFWGIKMYVALGYPPYLYDRENAQKTFPYISYASSTGYSRLLDFYRYCAVNKIPITCHGSPQGMTIADPGVYLKEYLKRTDKYKPDTAHFPVDNTRFLYGLGLIDDFSSPDSWKIVLDELGRDAKHFKLCLAHFGGSGFFTGEYETQTGAPYHWFPKICKLIENESYKVFTDISCFTFEGFKEMPPSVSDWVYNGIKKQHPVIGRIYTAESANSSKYGLQQASYKRIKDTAQMVEVMKLRLALIKEDGLGFEPYKEIRIAAENLVKCIQGTEHLRHRIMFGTDWPMTELGVTGTSVYTGAIFVLLQLVTDLLGNEWDAWHQFAVINPLRFLGLLQDEDNYDCKEYKMDFTRITKMKESLDKFCEVQTNKSKDADNCGLITNENRKNKIQRIYNILAEKYDDVVIPAAHMIKNQDTGRLLLAGG